MNTFYIKVGFYSVFLGSNILGFLPQDSQDSLLEFWTAKLMDLGQECMLPCSHTPFLLHPYHFLWNLNELY